MKNETIESYSQKVKSMNLAELQDHAISLGFKPSTNRQMLERTLINQFHKRVNPLYKVIK